MLRFAGAAALVIGVVLLALVVLLLLALLPRVRVDVEKAPGRPAGAYGRIRLAQVEAPPAERETKTCKKRRPSQSLTAKKP